MTKAKSDVCIDTVVTTQHKRQRKPRTTHCRGEEYVEPYLRSVPLASRTKTLTNCIRVERALCHHKMSTEEPADTTCARRGRRGQDN